MGIREDADRIADAYNLVKNVYQDDMESLPQGTVSFKKRGCKYIPYHVFYKDGRCQQIALGSINPANKKLVDKLVYKKFLKYLMPALENNYKSIEGLRKYKPVDLEKIIIKAGANYGMPQQIKDLIAKLSGIKELEEIVDVGPNGEPRYNTKYDAEMVELWFRDYSGSMKGFKEGERIIDAGFGYFVRSKSEMLIAFGINHVGLLSKYEEEKLINGKIFYPDFTILLPDGREVIWEHFGMMGNIEYKQNACRKISEYVKAGYRPCETFFATYEDGENELGGSDINRIIAMILAL